MDTTTRHLEFAPPSTPGLLRALVLAILAHGVLLAVLSVGVQWKREAVQQTFEAELWSAVPVEAAPPAPEPLPVPDPEPPKPAPPAPKPEPVTAPAETKAQADIALKKEKEKAKQVLEKKLALEKAALEKKKLAELEKKKLADLEKQKLAKLEQEKKDKLDKLDKQKKEQTAKLAREKDDQQRQLDAKETASLAKTRAEQLKRMEKLAGAGGNGAPGSTSTALEAKAPSDSYKGRIRAYIKRFHIYTETVVGNPTTEIEIRTASDGSILSRKITKSSGTKSWDDAALNAIDKAEKLPLDENGRAPPPMILVWSAQELGR